MLEIKESQCSRIVPPAVRALAIEDVVISPISSRDQPETAQ
ncbi:hypothetical protein [Phaeobacter porticola]|nr:hypothetical protein [Phaeobacter porticola]